MTKYLYASLLTLLLAFGVACGDGGGDDTEEDAGQDSGTTDSGTDAGDADTGPTCVTPVDGQSTTFLNQGECADPRVECSPFDNTRIPAQP